MIKSCRVMRTANPQHHQIFAKRKFLASAFSILFGLLIVTHGAAAQTCTEDRFMAAQDAYRRSLVFIGNQSGVDRFWIPLDDMRDYFEKDLPLQDPNIQGFLSDNPSVVENYQAVLANLQKTLKTFQSNANAILTELATVSEACIKANHVSAEDTKTLRKKIARAKEEVASLAPHAKKLKEVETILDRLLSSSTGERDPIFRFPARLPSHLVGFTDLTAGLTGPKQDTLTVYFASASKDIFFLSETGNKDKVDRAWPFAGVATSRSKSGGDVYTTGFKDDATTYVEELGWFRKTFDVNAFVDETYKRFSFDSRDFETVVVYVHTWTYGDEPCGFFRSLYAGGTKRVMGLFCPPLGDAVIDTLKTNGDIWNYITDRTREMAKSVDFNLIDDDALFAEFEN